MADLICILCKLSKYVENYLNMFSDPENLGIDLGIILLSHLIRKLWPKTGIPVMATLIYILCNWHLSNYVEKHLNMFVDPENLGVDLGIILLSCLIRKLGPKTGIPLMAALICILCKTLKGAKPASSRF